MSSNTQFILHRKKIHTNKLNRCLVAIICSAIVILSITLIFRIQWLHKAHALAEITGELVPTIENMSYYFTSDEGSSVNVQYSLHGANDWKTAFVPEYRDGQYRGSILELQSSTSYDVSITVSGAGDTKTLTLTDTTMDTTETILATKEIVEINLSQILGRNEIRYLEIQWLGANTEAYYHITADPGFKIDRSSAQPGVRLSCKDGHFAACLVDPRNYYVFPNGTAHGDSQDNYPITLSSSRVILDGLTIIGGQRGGVYMTGGCDGDATCLSYLPGYSHNRIVNSEIKGWGEVGRGTSGQDRFLNSDGSPTRGMGILLNSLVHSEIVIENNTIHAPAGTSAAWYGDTWNYKHPGDPLGATHGIYVGKNGQQTIIRNNDIFGTAEHSFGDGIASDGNFDANGGLNRDADVYDNFIFFGEDDGVELDGGQQNIRFYSNWVEHFMAAVSIGGNVNGPSFMFNNRLLHQSDTNNEGLHAIKRSVQDPIFLPNPGTTHIFNNTAYGPSPFTQADSYLHFLAKVWTRNNIAVTTDANRYTLTGQSSRNTFSDIDYDLIWNTGDPYKYAWTPRDYALNTLNVDPQLSLNDFSLQSGSPAINTALPVPGLTNIYGQTTLSHGAYGIGSSFRPALELALSQERLTLSPNTSDTITVSSTANSNINYQIINDSPWVNVSPASGTIPAHGQITLNISVDDSNTRVTDSGPIIISTSTGPNLPIIVHYNNPVIHESTINLNIDEEISSPSTITIKKYRNLVQNSNLSIGSAKFWDGVWYGTFVHEEANRIFYVKGDTIRSGGAVSTTAQETLWQDVYLESGKTYTATTQIRNFDATPANFLTRVRPRSGGTTINVQTTATAVAGQGWQHLENTFTVPSSGWYRIFYMRTDSTGNQTKTADFTNMRLFAENDFEATSTIFHTQSPLLTDGRYQISWGDTCLEADNRTINTYGSTINLNLVSTQACSGTPFVSLSVSASNLNFNITPSPAGVQDTDNLNITVATNNVNGYTLTMTTATNNTALTHESNPGLTIPSTTTTFASPLINNTWGYNQGSSATTFLPIPALNSSPSPIAQSSIPADDTVDLTVGIKVDRATANGIYANTLVFTAVTN